MADTKVSGLGSLTTTAAPDLLLVIDDPNGTPVSKKITVKNFFGAVPSNTVFSGSKVTIHANVTATANLTVTDVLTANICKITFGSTPASNNATTVGMAIGEMRYTNTHVYVAVNATSIKRIALSTF